MINKIGDLTVPPSMYTYVEQFNNDTLKRAVDGTGITKIGYEKNRAVFDYGDRTIDNDFRLALYQAINAARTTPVLIEWTDDETGEDLSGYFVRREKSLPRPQFVDAQGNAKLWTGIKATLEEV